MIRRAIWSLALMGTAALAQPATVTGSLLGADGNPMLAAHVHVAPALTAIPVASVPVGADGGFEVETEETGVLVLRFTGAHHRSLDVPLFVGPGETVVLDARLAATPVFTTPEVVRMQVYGSRSRRLDPQDDGTYAVTLRAEADTIAYQIAGAFKHGRPANGTAWDRLVWDGAGDYFAVLDAPGDSVRVTFDPRAIPQSNRLPGVTFADLGARAAQVAAVLADLDNRSERVYEARRRAIAQTRDASAEERTAALDVAMQPFGLDAENAHLAEAIAAEPDTVVRQALLLNYVSVETEPPSKAPALVAQTLREIGPASGLWALHPALVQRTLDLAIRTDSAAAAAAAQRILEQHPTPAVRGYVLLHRLVEADRVGATTTAQDLFLHLQDDTYAETDPGLITATLFEHYDTRGGIHVGAEVPDFTMQTLGDETVSRASLLGTVYLLDFWAIWCAPCIREMPTLHDAYERFRARGFEIVSVSFDNTAAEVEAFRAERFPMPWPNVHAGSDFGSTIAQTFEVGSLPRPLLVGSDGRIVARDATLRGANLERTLEQFLASD